MKWRLLKFFNESAIIENEYGQTITYPQDILPHDYAIGDQFTINFRKSEENTTSNQETIDIINTLLKTV